MKLSCQTPKGLKTFKEFWPYYALEHRNLQNRQMHFIGTLLTLIILVMVLWLKCFLFLFFLPITGYGFAWAGHFFIQKNRPATFSYPFWSLIADYLMFFYMLTGRMSEEVKLASAKIEES